MQKLSVLAYQFLYHSLFALATLIALFVVIELHWRAHTIFILLNFFSEWRLQRLSD